MYKQTFELLLPGKIELLVRKTLKTEDGYIERAVSLCNCNPNFIRKSSKLHRFLKPKAPKFLAMPLLLFENILQNNQFIPQHNLPTIHTAPKTKF